MRFWGVSGTEYGVERPPSGRIRRERTRWVLQLQPARQAARQSLVWYMIQFVALVLSLLETFEADVGANRLDPSLTGCRGGCYDFDPPPNLPANFFHFPVPFELACDVESASAGTGSSLGAKELDLNGGVAGGVRRVDAAGFGCDDEEDLELDGWIVREVATLDCVVRVVAW